MNTPGVLDERGTISAPSARQSVFNNGASVLPSAAATPVSAAAPATPAAATPAVQPPQVQLPAEPKTKREAMWDKFKAEDFNIGTIPGVVLGGWIPDILMAFVGPWLYGSAKVSAHFNVYSGIEEARHRFDNTQIIAPTKDYVASNEAFADMTSRLSPGMRLGG